MRADEDAKVDMVAEAIVKAAQPGLHDEIMELADVDKFGPKNVGLIPFDPRALARAAIVAMRENTER